uniref:non-specific serine/threonine protein kinase n=1 Tax=Chenopodium quinoa TaxID=63459 RepID=A0A803MYL4_CHEQI
YGTLGTFSYPFTTAFYPDCGICVINCEDYIIYEDSEDTSEDSEDTSDCECISEGGRCQELMNDKSQSQCIRKRKGKRSQLILGLGGGYGAVFKGELHDSCFMAVKDLKRLRDDGEEFINEVVSIGRTNHVNVVALLASCSSLPSKTLYSILVGIAKGLDYLHRGCNARILHFDIKPHNILLDEEFCPKISDFGLARLCPAKDSLVSMSEARGTIGYIAPEVFYRNNFGGVSNKSDVYSYGMMLLELVCGRRNVVPEAQQGSECTVFS